jgi:hypothetical protein
MSKKKKQQLQNVSSEGTEVKAIPEIKEDVKPTPSQDEVVKSLAAIYEGRPTKQWLNTFDRGRKKAWVRILVGTLFCLALLSAGAWLGFLFFGTSHFNGNGIELQIEGPQEITTGQEVTYFVNWFNVMREPLASARLQVTFPNDFVITSIDPQPSSDPNIFQLGAQPVEGRGTIKVTGMFTGAIGTQSAIQVISDYRPASYNSDFEQLQTKEISYTKSVLKGTLITPDKVIPGDTVSISFTMKNEGSKTMNALRIVFALPDGFVPATSTQEQLDAKQISFDLPSLDAGASTTTVLHGSFAAHSGGNATIAANVGFVREGGDFAAADHEEKIISVLAGDLDTDLIINGTQNDRSVKTGEWQHMTVSYQNMSGETLGNVTLTLHAELPDGSAATSSFLDWSKIDDQNKGIVANDTLTLTKDQIPDLKELKANADGMLDLSLPVKDTVPKGEDVPIRMIVEAHIGSIGNDHHGRDVKTKPITLRLQSDAAITATPRYATEEGAQVGSGPLPPEVGSSTTYRVEWHFTKTLHAIHRVSVTAALPPAVTWSGQHQLDAGDLSYDDQTKLVTWTINQVPEDVSDLIVSFDVTLRPAEADIGRFADLMGETRFSFTDDVSQESILRTSPSVSTDMPDDSIAGRKGVVVRP